MYLRSQVHTHPRLGSELHMLISQPCPPQFIVHILIVELNDVIPQDALSIL